ncbi:MAG TPA: RNHCP domain-containing protein [Thermomicrobiaceae bacterium]|nr:RNHCP domain-containing protein [Thermomicrobiaceae bacterium]
MARVERHTGDDEIDYPVSKVRKPNRSRRPAQYGHEWEPEHDHDHDHDLAGARRTRRAPEADTFRCKHCKRLVGPTLSGGRHRNHCPVCLYSRHVDGKTPGDRASDCRSLMEPIGVFIRPSGEQVVVHRCLGCDLERYNRVAADDNPLAVMRLPLVAAPRPLDVERAQPA